MTESDDIGFGGLAKAAFGMATVGDVMNAMNADYTCDVFRRRKAIDEINRRGIDVKTPASRLPYLLGGGAAGNFVAWYLGVGGVLRAVATAGGALIGNSVYNGRNPDPTSVRGYRIHTY